MSRSAIVYRDPERDAVVSRNRVAAYMCARCEMAYGRPQAGCQECGHP